MRSFHQICILKQCFHCLVPKHPTIFLKQSLFDNQLSRTNKSSRTMTSFHIDGLAQSLSSNFLNSCLSDDAPVHPNQIKKTKQASAPFTHINLLKSNLSRLSDLELRNSNIYSKTNPSVTTLLPQHFH